MKNYNTKYNNIEDSEQDGYVCPHCKNPIYDEEALLCLYCGESLEKKIGTMSKFASLGANAVFVGLFLFMFIVLCFLIAAIF